MCGIAGILAVRGTKPGDVLRQIGMHMVNTIRYRGPDDVGVWVDSSAGVSIAHSRLSIMDLSVAGHQPMVSKSGRWVMAFNGEIYNHLELRASLGGAAPAWQGHSDTETLLASIDRWGLVPTLQRCVGMFALALWDVHERILHLARDRFGEKPLYWGRIDGLSGPTWAFSSELKALRACPGFTAGVSRQALSLYLRFGYVPGPLSIYEGIYKLPPGTVLSLKASTADEQRPTPLAYWSMAETVSAARANPLRDEREGVQLLEERLKQAVQLQTLADVPLGAFLSGGVDSSTIVAMMQAHSSRPVQTFTIGFDEPGFDESPHAAAVATHLGTQHHMMKVTAAQARDVIPLLPQMYDEPFADSSQIPTHLVCLAARQQVTVALTGDAGDELFGGYNRYLWGPRVWRRIGWLPHPLRRALGVALQAVQPTAWDSLGGMARVAHLGDKVNKLAVRMQSARNLDDLYWSLVEEWPAEHGLVIGLDAPAAYDELVRRLAVSLPELQNPAERMMFSDTLSYLPDDILCKVDRAGMAVSLETRVPFLDHRVAELAWRLPMRMKVRGGQGKWALRQVLYKYVPAQLIERPKAGFGIPLGRWLRGPLRDWAEVLLSEERLQAEGWLEPAPIRHAWAEHLSGRRDWTQRLWTVLMFQDWWRAQCRM
jgi:asparagine synthase (glutamine-hydrolysing)